MMLTLEIDLTPEDLATIQASTGAPFMTADALKEYLSTHIADTLKSTHQPLPMGWLWSVKYYTPNPAKRSGFELHEHIFQGSLWPHVQGRPMLVADGPTTLKTVGGAFVVDRMAGIVDTSPH